MCIIHRDRKGERGGGMERERIEGYGGKEAGRKPEQSRKRETVGERVKRKDNRNRKENW